VLTSDDLRIRLGHVPDDWSANDDVRAEAVLSSARTVIVTMAGVEQVAQAETDGNEGQLAALDEATLVYAVPIFENPGRRLQRRLGDFSESFADSNEAASALKEARAILSAAGFGGAGKAFAIDTVRTSFLDQHAEWCALAFGADYCDCGANLAGYPIFGQPS
jgi:hypothetical protein